MLLVRSVLRSRLKLLSEESFRVSTIVSLEFEKVKFKEPEREASGNEN